MLSATKSRAARSLSAIAAALSICAVPAVAAETITAVMHSPLRVLDPFISSAAAITRNHAYMIYDTLLAIDSNYKVQPQMAEKWEVSPDRRTYTFTLRDGLKWHDGAPVKAEDCVASIKRWAELDKMGQLIMAAGAELKVVNDKSFQVVLKEPSDLLLTALAKPSATAAFVLPKRMAETPATQAIKEHIGSGPFRFVASEFKPGLKAVYEKNKDYVPRKEPSSWAAGGKVVHVDRVEWVAMPDQMTAANALINGEIDYFERVPFDLVPTLEAKKDIKVTAIDKLGSQAVYRFNHTQPPFNNKLLRQAAMYAVGQEEVLKAVTGGRTSYFKTCAAVFGCGTPLESNYGSDILIPSNLEKAKQLLKQANYDGTPVVILQPTDVVVIAAQPIVIADALRKAGFNVTLQAMDWQTLLTRRVSKEHPSKGGWSLIAVNNPIPDVMDPVRNFMVAANGAKAWVGWPDLPQVEDLRARFAKASSSAEQKKIADEVQKIAIDEGIIVPLGQVQFLAAYRTSLKDVPEAPFPFFWNVKKAGK